MHSSFILTSLKLLFMKNFNLSESYSNGFGETFFQSNSEWLVYELAFTADSSILNQKKREIRSVKRLNTNTVTDSEYN